MRRAIGPACLAAVLLGSTASARAEIGLPAAPGSVYVGVGSGYHHENGSNVAAQGATATGPGNGPGTGPAAGGITIDTASASNGNSLSSSNGANSAAFAGGAAASNARTSITATSGPSGTASASSRPPRVA